MQSNDDPHWVKTRQRDVGAAGFALALEEEEASASPHGQETIGWLAIDAGQGDWNGHLFEAVQTPEAVTHDWYSIVFGQTFGQGPRFVASLSTYNSANGCALRYQNLAAGGVEVKVEEDTTWDSETNHTGEGVAYLAIQGDGLLTAEVSGGGAYTETLYYFFDGQRVAMRQDDMLYYIIGDHLGTTSAVFDAGGSLHSQSRHYPYGTERWATGAVPTDYRFTGQRLQTQIGLYHMGARFYEPALALWVSADCIVPNPRNPRALNRYSWVFGNPLIFRDPTGHCPLGIGYRTCRRLVNIGSSLGLVHGRHDVRNHQATIAALAVEYEGVDAILVAAFIAHQASDWKERPFGSDQVDKAWAWVKLTAINKPASQGIAQLRPHEVEQ